MVERGKKYIMMGKVKKALLFIMICVLEHGVVFADRSFAEESKKADFFTSVEKSYGGSLKLSIFQNGSQVVPTLNLSQSAFDTFADQRFWNFFLTKENDNLLCHLHDQSLDITYGFHIDFSGNIYLSSENESTTGVNRRMKYAFKTDAVIKNYNPVSFYALFTNSREIHNYSILKTKDYLFWYDYFYNSGVVDTKYNHASRADMKSYSESKLLPPSTPPPPFFKEGEKDNYGIEIRDSVCYYGGAIKINSYGVSSYSNVHFETPGSSLNIDKGLFRVTDALSGNLLSVNVGDGARVDIFRIKVSPLNSFGNRGTLFIGADSAIDALEAFNSGEIWADRSLTFSYNRLRGDGKFFVCGTLTCIKNADTPVEGDMRILAGTLISEERFGEAIISRIEHGHPKEIESFMNAEHETLIFIGKMFDKLGIYENEIGKIAKNDISVHGSFNKNFIRLKRSGVELGEIEKLLANPYAYRFVDVDLEIDGTLCDFYIKSDDDQESLELVKTAALSSISLACDLRKLQEIYPDIFELLMEIWSRNITTMLANEEEKEAAARAVIASGWYFFSHVSSLGIFSGVEAIAEMVTQRGISWMTSVASTAEQATIRNSLEFIKNLAKERGIRRFVIPVFS